MEKNFLIIAIIMMIILIIKLLRFKKELDDKNIKLIQFYLDKKFINKSIANIIESKCWNQFHSDLIENIKEYFQFDDVVCLKIFDIENYENNNCISNLPSSIEQVKEFLQKKKAAGNLKLQYSHISFESIITTKGRYKLYLYPYSAENKSAIIVCMKKEPGNLNNDVICTLKDLINLLRISFAKNSAEPLYF